MKRRTLLLEVGCEELPSSSLRALGEGLGALLECKLRERGLSFGDLRWYASPRRLAVQVRELVEQAPDEARQTLGPPLARARDDNGNWSRAAQGFAARQGVAAQDLQVIDTAKGARLGVARVVPGAKTVDVLAELVAQSLRELPVAKRMRWGASRLEFARPLHWLVLLFGRDSDFGEILGLKTGNTSRGHRFHAPGTVLIENAEAYVDTLRAARVVVDFKERRESIREQVTCAARALQATPLIDKALLEEVTSLVEWPVALTGGFDERFLDVPAEALISSMQRHQKYFPLVNTEGKLLPHFIAVSNIESRDPQQVVRGNEQVIRPRLADAAFFYARDRQQRLESRVATLDAVVFQDKLGSLGDRARRISALARRLAQRIGADAELAARAGLLCKADLVSEMVLEFADMQGIAGAYYARSDGEDERVARAIEQHYWPLQAGGTLPEEGVAIAVALAERLDTLVAIFGIGHRPDGSRDPFALRRAAIAVLRIAIEKDLALDLQDALEQAHAGLEDGSGRGLGAGAGLGDGSGSGRGLGAGAGLGDGSGSGRGLGAGAGLGDGSGSGRGLGADVVATVLEYILDRLPAFYEGPGAGAGLGDGSGSGRGFGAGAGLGDGSDSGRASAIPVEVIRAVRASGCTRPKEFHQRVLAVQEFRAQADAGLGGGSGSGRGSGAGAGLGGGSGSGRGSGAGAGLGDGSGSGAGALVAANKRVSNLLAKAEKFDLTTEVNASLLREDAEKALARALAELDAENRKNLAAGRYAAALQRMAALQAPVDAFFDGVMVNVDDLALRRNRLALLAKLRRQFLAVADLSLLAG